jgi:hypothetical protein
MKLQVVLSRGAEVLARGVFDEAATIGRAPDCDIQVDDPTFSRRHARLEPHGRAWSIRDLGSTNGIIKDGRPISELAINDGDEVAVGEYRISFALEEPLQLELPPPQDLPLLGALGATFQMAVGPEKDQGQRERSSNLRGFLVIEGQREPCWLVETDAFLIGAQPEADLRLRGLLAPRLAATIVRGYTGFSIVNMVGRDRAVRVQGVAVPRQTRLSPADLVEVGGHRLRFHTGRPPQGTPCIAQTSRARRPV